MEFHAEPSLGHRHVGCRQHKDQEDARLGASGHHGTGVAPDGGVVRREPGDRWNLRETTPEAGPDSMTVPNQSEQFRPPPNDPPGDTLLGKLRFTGRTVADLQVSSVLQHLKPWLADIRGTVLEVGCGAQPYRHFVSAGCQYTGLDWEQAEEGFSYRTPDTIYYDGGEFPFTETTFDFVFHTEVLEHI